MVVCKLCRQLCENMAENFHILTSARAPTLRQDFYNHILGAQHLTQAVNLY